MRSKLPTLIAASLLFSVTQTNAINITFDYSFDSNGFFDDPARRNVLESAGNFLGSRLNDTLDPISNVTNVTFTNPSTNVAGALPTLSVAQDSIKIFVGGRDLGVNTTGGDISGVGTPSFFPFNITGASAHRGETGALTNPPTDFGPWGGRIAFDIDTQWYVDPDTTTLESFVGQDFFSVALHEIGHVLGLGTGPSWDANVAQIPGGGNIFLGAATFNVSGMTDNLDEDGIHFAQGTSGFGGGLPGQSDALMVPFIGSGMRRLPTNLDYAALSDIGWEVTAVPIPPALFLFLSGLTGFASIAIKKRRKLF